MGFSITKMAVGIYCFIRKQAAKFFVVPEISFDYVVPFPSQPYFGRLKPVWIKTNIAIIAIMGMHYVAIAQNCTPGTTSFDINLSSSPTATWQTPQSVTPNGQCCGAPGNHRCMEFVVRLHPGANAISIVFTVPTGSVYYQVNCGPAQPVKSNTVNICFGQGDVGPHYISFCRNGTPSYEFTVYSIKNDMEVTLNPFAPVCESAMGFMLTGGSPPGGTYYINGEASPFFLVGQRGPGNHEITYVYTDPVKNCSGFATQILKVLPLPQITWATNQFCNYEGWRPLNGASPAGGLYTGNWVSNNSFNSSAVIPGLYPVSYSYTDTHGCSNTSQGWVRINETPLADAGADQTITSGTTVTLNGSATPDATYSYAWEPVSYLTTPNQQTTQTIPLEASRVFNLTVTNTTTQCKAKDQVQVNIINGDIQITDLVGLPSSICVGGESQLWVLPGGGSGNYSYYWEADPPDAPNFPTTVKYPLARPSQTTVYTVTVTDNLNPLNKISMSMVLTVNPIPQVSLDLPAAVCANTPNFALTGGLPIGGRYYMLDMSGNVLNLPYINFSNFLPNDIGVGKYQVMYEYTDPNTGCKNRVIKPFEILPYVNAQFYASRDDLCVSNEVKIANHSVGNVNYFWDFGDGTTSNTSQSTFNHTFPLTPQIKDYTIRLVASHTTANCSSSRQRTVKVYPPVVADFTATATTGCSDLEVKFENTSSGPILYHLWNFGDGTFSIQPNPTKVFMNYSDKDTIFYVSLTVMSTNNFCFSTRTIPITVYPAIKAGFGLTSVAGCHPFEARISNLSFGAKQYAWDFGNGLTSNLPEPGVIIFSNLTNNVIQYTIKQVVRNQHCIDSFEQVIDVYPVVRAALDVSVSEGCSPVEVTFTNLSTPTATHVLWDFGDGGSSASDSTVVHIFENNTDQTITYTVWLKVRSGEFCRDSVSIPITVRPYLRAGFDFAPAEACNPHNIIINNNSLGASTYNWQMGDGTTYTSAGPVLSHQYNHNNPNPLNYRILLTVTNTQGCRDTLSRAITIFPKIIAGFTIPVNEGCTPLEIDFSNTTVGASRHRWEFGDGGSTIEISPRHVFENTSFTRDTVFTVWLYSESEYLCRDSISRQIRVFPRVRANFTVNDNRGCSPLLVSIDNLTQGASAFHWNFSNGNTSTDSDPILTQVFENKTSEVESFRIYLTATNGNHCQDTLSRMVSIYPEVNISYSHVVEGCQPLDVSINNLTENANYYSWNFGDGILSNQYSPRHIFSNFDHHSPTEYNLSLYASSVYGCFASASSQVRVLPKPDARFNVLNSPGCSPYEIEIEHLSQGANFFEWNFGDSQDVFNHSDARITHSYNHGFGNGPATFNITLYTENGYQCADTLVQKAVIYPNINASFTTSVVEGCHPLTVEFTNNSTGATAMAAYGWQYGNGFSSGTALGTHSHTFNNLSHTRDTVFTVRLTAYNQNGCHHTDSINIRVFPKPKAHFSVPNNPGCAPFDAFIYNLSQGATQYAWNMGNGSTQNTADATFTHRYYQPSTGGPGNYIIRLDTENQYQCTDSHQEQVVVYPEMVVDFTADAEGCNPFTATFTNLSSGGELYLWDFGNGLTSKARNAEQTFTNYSHTDAATYTVSLSVESTWGCKADTSMVITVHPIPKPLFGIEPFSGCSPFTPEVANLSAGGTRYYWNMGNDGFYRNDASFTHTWNNPEHAPVLYPVTLTIWNDFGCMDEASQMITVYPEVIADYTTTDDIWQGCSPLTTKFINTSIRSDSNRWTFGDGGKSGSAAPLYVFRNEGIDNVTFPVHLTATSLYGCKNTITRQITVFPSPKVDFYGTPEWQPYPNTTITFRNATNPGHWNFLWEFGDGNNTTTTSRNLLDHSYVWDESDMSTKEYVVALIASSEHCSDMMTKTFRITSPVPKADFTTTHSGCQPFTVQFSNFSQFAHTYRWIFDDGAISTDPAPRHTFVDHGIFNVLLVAIGDGGRDTTYHPVEVIQNPEALFSLEKPIVSIPEEPLRLRNHSVRADQYLWDFGDGNYSFDYEPEHYYTDSGIYNITLVATRNSQPACRDTLILKNALRVEETCKIIFPNAFKPSKAGPSGGSYDLNNPSTQVFHPVYEGVEEYALVIYNRWGELIFRSDDITKGWDGYHNGRLSQMDVYVWKVTGRCRNGRSIIMAGDVTLYR